MKILHVFPYLFDEGGIPHQTRRLIAAQAHLSHDVITISLSGALLESFRTANPSVNIISVRTFFEGQDLLWHLLRTDKPDIVHFTDTWIPIYQFWVRVVQRERVPYVVSIHGNFSPYSMKSRFGEKKTRFYHIWAKQFWQRYLDLPFLRKAAGIHVHSNYEVALLSDRGLKRVFVVPTGIDTDWINLEDPNPRTLHGYPMTFLHLGRLDIYHKGLDLVCEAAQILWREGFGRKCRFLFIGPTVGDSKMRLAAIARAFESRFFEVRDAVWGQEKTLVWSEADFFLNLYRFAGMGRAPAEAVGQGIPLLSSRESNWGDWAFSEEMGFSVPLNAEKICHVIKHILHMAGDEYKRFSRNARKFSHGHSWEKVASQLLKGYQESLD